MPPKYSFYSVTLPQSGEIMSSSGEVSIINIIDNQIRASLKGISFGVFLEGSYSVIDNGGGDYTVRLSPGSETYSISGLVSGGLLQTDLNIEWTGLKDGSFYYIYLQWTESLYEDSESFNVVSQKDSINPSEEDKLLLATLDLTGASPSLDTYPDGKIYISQYIHGPSSSTDNNIPEFLDTNGDAIGNGYPLVTTIGITGADTNIPTEQAVREAIKFLPIKTVTNSNYVASQFDYTVLFNTGSSTRTCYLPQSSTVEGLILNLKKIDNGVGYINVDGYGSETIDGSLAIQITGQWQSVRIQNDGNNWYKIGWVI